MANLAARRKMKNAARFAKSQHREPTTTAARDCNSDTRQAHDPEDVIDDITDDVVDASTSYELEERRVKAEKEMGNEALILVYGFNANLYEDVFVLNPNASTADIKRSYQEQMSQLEHCLATEFTSDVPDDEINAALTYSQMQAALLCGMTSEHMEKMHPRNFVEVKMDALKRAFGILGDEQSRIEYDAVLLEYQESTKEKLDAVDELDEDDEEFEEADREVEYGEHGDYSYEDDDAEETDDDLLSEASADSSAVKTVPNNEGYNVGSFGGEANEPYLQSPSQALAKHPWKQEQFQEQPSPRDPFDFDQQYHQYSMPEEGDYSVMTTPSTRSVHADLFDPFDLQGADQINLHHLPMVDHFTPEEDDSVYTEEEQQDKKEDDTVTVYTYPLPKVDEDDEDEGDDITVGEVIEARERGEDVVLPQRPINLVVDVVPKKKKGMKPKLRSFYQSMKRSTGGSSKGSRSITSDSAKFQSKGVRVMSLMPSKKNTACDDESPLLGEAKRDVGIKSIPWTSIDPLRPNLSAEESNDDVSEAFQIYQADDTDDLISDLTMKTFPQQQRTLQTEQPQQVEASNTDMEVETFLNMANNFRAMDVEAKNVSHHESEEYDNESLSNSRDGNSTSMSTAMHNSANNSVISSDKTDDYLKHYPRVGNDEEINEEEFYEEEENEEAEAEDDKTHTEKVLDEWIVVIDEVEEFFGESLEGISSVLSCA